MPNTNYVLKVDVPITLPLTAGEDIGYDDTPVFPLPPNTTVGSALHLGVDGLVYAANLTSTNFYVGVNEIPSRKDKPITVRKVGVIIFPVGDTQVDPGMQVKLEDTALQTAGDVVPWVGGTDYVDKLVGQAITGGVVRTSASVYATVQVVLKGW